MNTFATEQEAFWAGGFGDDYVERNKDAELLAANVAFFARILSRTDKLDSILEMGANVGMNIRALKTLLPSTRFEAVEINEKAAGELKKIPDIVVHNQSLYDYRPSKSVDFVFMKGVMIHLHPDKLPDVYQLMYEASSRYICIAEYYNPTPVSLSYRGHSDRLFKRDFAGEVLQKFPDLRLRDYGFAYRGDVKFAQDDITWFLLEKPAVK